MSQREKVTISLPENTNPAAVSSIMTAIEQTLALLVLRQGDVIASADRMAELATINFKPDLALQQERINRMKTVERVRANTTWRTAADLHNTFYRQRLSDAETGHGLDVDHAGPARRRKSSPSSDWKRRRRVFSVNYQGQEIFAAYQFDADLRPLPLIKKVIAAFGPVDDMWTLAAWFCFPNNWLTQPVGGKPVARAPMDALDDGEAVVRAAKMRLESYVA